MLASYAVSSWRRFDVPAPYDTCIDICIVVNMYSVTPVEASALFYSTPLHQISGHNTKIKNKLKMGAIVLWLFRHDAHTQR